MEFGLHLSWVYSVEVCGVLLRQWSVLVVDLMSVEFRIKVTLESCFPVGVQRLPESSALFKKDKHRKKHSPLPPLAHTQVSCLIPCLFNILCFEIQQMDRDVSFISKSSAILLHTCNRIINSRTFSRSLT